MLERANWIPPTIYLFSAHIHLHVTQFEREYNHIPNKYIVSRRSITMANDKSGNQWNGCCGASKLMRPNAVEWRKLWQGLLDGCCVLEAYRFFLFVTWFWVRQVCLSILLSRACEMKKTMIYSATLWKCYSCQRKYWKCINFRLFHHSSNVLISMLHFRLE